MTSTIRKFHIIPLLAAVLLLGAYHFTGAAWTSAPSNPPNANVRPPINVGTSGGSQSIAGSVVVDRVAADVVVTTNTMASNGSVRSNSYCDRNGNNCFQSSEVASGAGAGGGLGYDQTWQTVNRKEGVWYQNTTGKPIMVFHKNIWNGTLVRVGASKGGPLSGPGGVELDFRDFDSDLDNGSTFIVPPNHYYRFYTKVANEPGAYVYRELR